MLESMQPHHTYRSSGGAERGVDLYPDRLPLQRYRPELLKLHQIACKPGSHRVHHNDAAGKSSRSAECRMLFIR